MTQVAKGDHVVMRVHPVLRPVPLVLDGPAEPVRPGRDVPRRAACPTAARFRFHGRRGRRRDVHARHVLAVRDDRRGRRCVKVDEDLPLEVAVLVRLRRAHRLGLGGQRRPTYRSRRHRGRSSASAASARTPSRAQRMPARPAIIAVDPLENKREKAEEIGATHSRRRRPRRRSSSQELTWGRRRRRGDRHRGRRRRGGGSGGRDVVAQGRHDRDHRPRRSRVKLTVHLSGADMAL